MNPSISITSVFFFLGPLRSSEGGGDDIIRDVGLRLDCCRDEWESNIHHVGEIERIENRSIRGFTAFVCLDLFAAQHPGKST